MRDIIKFLISMELFSLCFIVLSFAQGTSIVGKSKTIDNKTNVSEAGLQASLPLSGEPDNIGRLDGAVPVVSFPSPESVQNPAFSPDGATMIYTAFHEGYNAGPAGVFSCTASGGNSISLIDEKGHDSVNLPGTSWNPVTNRITFASDRGEGPDEIWTMAADGSELTQITNHSANGYYIEPSFSSDGQWIVFEADTDAQDDEMQQGSIFKVRSDGTELTKLTDGPAGGTDDRQPNWSPTNESILFQRRVPGSNDWDIYTLNPDGTNLQQVTTTSSSDTDASFSPDGRWIVYSSDYGGLEMPNIFIIQTTGGSPVRITHNDFFEDGAPSWSPDGRWIAFESHPGADEDTPAEIWRIAATMPELLITANGTAGSVTVNEGEPVTVMISLDAGIFTGAEADWWLASVSPSGTIKTFDLSVMDFRSEIAPTLQGSLTSFQPLVLSSLSSLEAGNHAFYFGIDLNRNGQLDAENLFYNSVNVNVGVSEIDIRPTGSDKAITVYNQAYQENFEEDKIADIIQHARNAYVLIDPFQEGIAASILDIKANGNEIGGYISIGTGENWRADFPQLQPYLVTKQWGQWEGEYFVNKTTSGIIPLMKARIDSMAEWGCDWVEFDNMDWVFDDDLRNQYGFQVTESEGIAYYQELCDYVHQKGMKCMAKNLVEGASEFDGVLYESSGNEKNWWDNSGTQSFLDAGKLVIINHYNENNCDRVYLDYMNIYNKDLSFICEDAELKKYVHYNEGSDTYDSTASDLLAAAYTWMYQIQGLDEDGAVNALAASNYPLLVLEPGHNFSDSIYPTAAIVSALHRTPDDQPRLLLAYIDIGQAEDYRDYWGTDWVAPTANQPGTPDFLITIDPDGWSGNYPVAYWRQKWKDIWLGGHGIIASLAAFGFDGIYLDWVEAYDDEKVIAAAVADAVDPKLEMILFIEELRAAGRAVDPDFLVIPQNAPYLIDAAPDRYAAAIDGLAVEDTWFHGDGDAQWNDPRAGDLHERHQEEWSTPNRLLQYQKYLSRGLPVFSVDYCISTTNAAQVYTDASAAGLRPLVTRVSLSAMTETPP